MAGIFYDFHTHTFFSDGDLSPSELVYRGKVAGYRAIALTDHCDLSNIDFVVKRMCVVSKVLSKEYGITVIPGAELTYVPPRIIPETIMYARRLGAKIVVVHGETTVEPVPPGTNYAAVKGKADILAHPGKLEAEVARIAAKNGVLLELTTRRGHKLTNLRVAQTAKKCNAKLVINTDTHTPENIMDTVKFKKLVKQAGLTLGEIDKIRSNSIELIRKKGYTEKW
ncbi:MAG: histidinol phosphate phosphatase domain-containing protein [Elusimicrobiota bacterium]